MARANDVVLNPGDFCFGGAGMRVHTLLGSCVSITLWHPGRKVGGMCHFMLPRRPGKAGGDGTAGRSELDGRYADDAIQMFLRELRRNGTRPEEYQVKMFGGGNQFPATRRVAALDIAQDNITAGLRLLEEHGFTLTTGQVGGTGACRLLFELDTGDVWLNCLDQAPAREFVAGTEAGRPDQGWVFRSTTCSRSPL